MLISAITHPNYDIGMFADMKELNIDLNKWEELVMDRSKWRSYLQAAFNKKGNNHCVSSKKKTKSFVTA